jgi:hypothetical protein
VTEQETSGINEAEKDSTKQLFVAFENLRRHSFVSTDKSSLCRATLPPYPEGSSAVMGLPGFEPGSREPKSPSLDQTSRQPLLRSLSLVRPINDFALIIKTSTKLQSLRKNHSKRVGNSFSVQASMSLHAKHRLFGFRERWAISLQWRLM